MTVEDKREQIRATLKILGQIEKWSQMTTQVSQQIDYYTDKDKLQ